MKTATIALVLLLMPLPAKGHQAPTIIGGHLTTRPIQEWDLAVRLEGALTPTLINMYNQSIRVKPQPKRTTVHHHRATWPVAGVEQWRTLVEKYFQPADIPWAMRVMACESGGNPLAKNPYSSASGLFQHLARYWEGRSAKAGIPGADIFDPESNIKVAAWLFYTGGPQHWVCK